jgi:hypothetical protein
MERRKLIEQNQKVTQQDFLDFGLFPQASLDSIGSGLLIPDAAYWGFNVAEQSAVIALVGPGHLIYQGRVYVNDDEGGVEIDLISRLPVATRKYVVIGVNGNEVESQVEPRTFLIDATTRQTEAVAVPTVMLRRAEISVTSGTEGPDPVPPALPSNVLEVARILLDTDGIVSVEMNTENLAPSLRTLQVESLYNKAWRERISAQIDTLMTIVAALAGRIGGLAPRALVIQIAGELAEVKERVALPDNYSDWGFDYFLDDEESDLLDADWLSVNEEGARFPDAAVRDAQLAILNPADANVSITSNFMLPNYTPVARVEVKAHDAELGISQTAFQTITVVRKTRVRRRVRHGSKYTVSKTWAYWQTTPSRYLPTVGIFKRALAEALTEQTPGVGFRIARVKRHWNDKVIKANYWAAIVSTLGVNGSFVAQSFLNVQEGWLVGVDLLFSRKASTGDVTVMICEVGEDGQPNVDNVLSTSTIPVANIVADLKGNTWTLGTIAPTLLSAGDRYAVVLATGGAHFVFLATGNKLMNGSMFTNTDGEWSQGDLTKDISMRLRYASFANPRVEVMMQPLQLENGIASIDINVDSAEPEGFTIEHQIQQSGVWTTLNEAAPDILIGLPALLPYRLVFNGSTDMMPGIGVGANSRVLTSRPRTDFVHVSEDRNMSGTVNTVQVVLRLEQWRGDPHHACAIKLMHGASFATETTPDSIQDEVAPDDADALIRTAVFDLTPGTIDAYKIKIEGDTDNAVTPFHVSQRQDVAWTA